MTKVIFLLGWFCLNGECSSVNQKHKSIEDCKFQGSQIKLILDENNIRKYFLACVNISDEYF